MTDIYEGERTCRYCGASCFEVLEEDRGECLVECLFCLHGGEWAPMPKGRKKKPAAKPTAKGAASFRFKYGRYEGMTVAEVDREPNGRRYLEHVATTNDGKIGSIAAEYLSGDALLRGIESPLPFSAAAAAQVDVAS